MSVCVSTLPRARTRRDGLATSSGCRPILEPKGGIEPPTPFLPRTCSASELLGRNAPLPVCTGPENGTEATIAAVVEGAGFEPAKPFRAPDLQSGGFNHSPTPPGRHFHCTRFLRAPEGTRTPTLPITSRLRYQLRHRGAQVSNSEVGQPAAPKPQHGPGNPGAIRFSPAARQVTENPPRCQYAPARPFGRFFKKTSAAPSCSGPGQTGRRDDAGRKPAPNPSPNGSRLARPPYPPARRPPAQLLRLARPSPG